ncbi:hypothetical protein QUA00_15420 [Microcoleus sp. T2B6]|uniref:hypothetical protein n=1 Tax=Microcoleus sp. T2B6 TaxID=3055424 RepID=UPI002FD4376A
MNNPFDDASQSGSHSPLDDFIQSLSSDSHSSDSHHNSNHHPSDPLDLSHLHLNLGEVHHPHDLNHVGALDGVDHSHHSLMTPAGALDAAYRESLAEIKTDLYSESHPQGLVSHSTISQTDRNHYQDSFSSDNYSENVVDFSAKSSSTNSGVITKDDDNSVKFVGDIVFWNAYARGQAGTVDGHKFYRDGHCIGRLGANMNVYDVDGHKIGYVTPSGKAYTTDDKLFATGGTARWAAATLIFNTCSLS